MSTKSEKHGQKSNANKNPHSVAVGQFWRSTAKDQAQIPFRIVGVDLHTGTARVLAEYTKSVYTAHGWEKRTFGQERSIRLDRFRPGSRGYERTTNDGAPVLSKEPVTKPEPVINIPTPNESPAANALQQASEAEHERTHPQPPAEA